MKSLIDEPNFIAVWNAAKSVDEFCLKTGYKKKNAYDRAGRLRRNGRQLKRFTDDPGFMQAIGSKGGKNTPPEKRGFYLNRELARLAGQKGGSTKKRGSDD